MKNLKLKFTHFSVLGVIVFSMFMASCEDNPIEINLTCTDLDYIALRALYLSTDGDNWRVNTGWPTAAEFEANPNMPAGTDVSTWIGIFTNADGCVTCIEMTFPDPELGLPECEVTGVTWIGNNLTGNIPPEIGLLPQLTGLNIAQNQLTGSIPPELGNLNNLERLFIYENNLSSNIPSELGNLNNLEWLIIGENNLSGNIPPELGNLSNLDWLSIGGNNLSGNIPPELENLNNLKSLSMGENNLSGNIPPELGNLNNLEWLRIGGNNLSGSIPPEFGNLGSLEFFVVNNNQLSGCYDSNLASLCPKFSSGIISDGNNFDAPWDDFCATGAGTCTP